MRQQLKRTLSSCNIEASKTINDYIKFQQDAMREKIPNLNYDVTKPSMLIPKQFDADDYKLFIDDDMLRSLTDQNLINWSSVCRSLIPVLTEEDVTKNSLWNAVSIYIFGVHDRKRVLRQLVYKRLFMEIEKDGRIRKRWLTDIQTLLGPSSQENADQLWNDILLSCSQRIGKDFHTMAIHIFTLANILARPIIVVSDDIDLMDESGGYERNIAGVYLPLTRNHTACEKSPVLLCYDNKRFAPLLSSESLKVPFTKFDVNETAQHCIPLQIVDGSDLEVPFLTHEEGISQKDVLENYLHIAHVPHENSQMAVAFLKFKAPLAHSIELLWSLQKVSAECNSVILNPSRKILDYENTYQSMKPCSFNDCKNFASGNGMCSSCGQTRAKQACSRQQFGCNNPSANNDKRLCVQCYDEYSRRQSCIPSRNKNKPIVQSEQSTNMLPPSMQANAQHPSNHFMSPPSMLEHNNLPNEELSNNHLMLPPSMQKFNNSIDAQYPDDQFQSAFQPYDNLYKTQNQQSPAYAKLSETRLMNQAAQQNNQLYARPLNQQLPLNDDLYNDIATGNQQLNDNIKRQQPLSTQCDNVGCMEECRSEYKGKCFKCYMSLMNPTHANQPPFPINSFKAPYSAEIYKSSNDGVNAISHGVSKVNVNNDTQPKASDTLYNSPGQNPNFDNHFTAQSNASPNTARSNDFTNSATAGGFSGHSVKNVDLPYERTKVICAIPGCINSIHLDDKLCDAHFAKEASSSCLSCGSLAKIDPAFQICNQCINKQKEVLTPVHTSQREFNDSRQHVGRGKIHHEIPGFDDTIDDNLSLSSILDSVDDIPRQKQFSREENFPDREVFNTLPRNKPHVSPNTPNYATLPPRNKMVQGPSLYDGFDRKPCHGQPVLNWQNGFNICTKCNCKVRVLEENGLCLQCNLGHNEQHRFQAENQLRKCVEDGCRNPGFENLSYFCESCYNKQKNEELNALELLQGSVTNPQRIIQTNGPTNHIIEQNVLQPPREPYVFIDHNDQDDTQPNFAPLQQGGTNDCKNAGCTFFGSVEYGGLCSSCFMERTKNDVTVSLSNYNVRDIRRQPLQPAEQPIRAPSPQTQFGYQSYQQQAPVPCQNPGCEMFGSPAFNGLCSQCYKNQVERDTYVLSR